LIVNQITWSQLPSYLVAEVVGSLAGAGLFAVSFLNTNHNDNVKTLNR